MLWLCSAISVQMDKEGNNDDSPSNPDSQVIPVALGPDTPYHESQSYGEISLFSLHHLCTVHVHLDIKHVPCILAFILSHCDYSSK